MKALSKPISSPGRQDKFPPPLMRFLKTNVGSKSRGRLRSSPMFYLRTYRKSIAGVIETTQEPSSPKVTCIGQVRVRRFVKIKAKRTAGNRPRRWWRIKKPLFCGKISSRIRSQNKPFRSIFGKWGLFFRFGYCKKVDVTEDSYRVYSDQKCEKNENIGAGVEEIKRDFVESSSSSLPPKNALLLTRCRSAPYRSSSLGGRFWGSPLKTGENETETENEAKSEELVNPICEKLVEESRISEESSKELENSSDLKVISGSAMHPLLLMRCKSEPARTGERLIGEANFLKQRRLGAIEPCSVNHSS